VLDSAGDIYGTTTGVGAFGLGAVYGIGKKGRESLLHSFDGSDGYIPNGALVRDSSGSLYGTTQSGGPSGYGTVFVLKP